jgi:hypothetical protein
MRTIFSFSLIVFFSVLSQAQLIKMTTDQADEQIKFGISKIYEAGNKSRQGILSIHIVADSSASLWMVKDAALAPIKQLGDQHYAIRIKQIDKTKEVYILASESTGAMYGALDIAEAMECNSLDRLKESDNAPYIIKRGIKFNIPLDLRTPTYSDPGDANQLNIENVWDIKFWKEYFDQMAIHRYNVMTWWSLQPFPSMVKVPEFPDIALNDVWRTKEKYDDTYSSQGAGFDRPVLFKNVEIVKKMTIDEKIDFWKKVMQMAADRGIDIYLFTWNLFIYGTNGKYGITKDQNNETTIKWFRASVREMIKTYPLLRGIGITAGEQMENKRTDEYANEKWLWKTYGEGIRDGLKDQPQRKFTLIHRFHWASMKEIQSAFADLPCRLEVSLKYAIAHMYSIPNPPFILPAMPLLSPQVQSWLTLRNDDIYSFRWANNDFARKFIHSIPEIEKIAGFYMGPDGYCWGRDYLSKLIPATKPRQLIIEKQWYSFMLWGRLGYDPDLPDETFYQHLPVHFPGVNTTKLMKGWSASSMIFPWITRFVWGDIDLKWFPEANLSHPSHKGFYTVKDYIERVPMEGSHIIGILPWAKSELNGIRTDSLTPLDVADTLERLSDTSFVIWNKLWSESSSSAENEYTETMDDIVSFVAIGKYYAEKIRAACDLALLDATRNEKYRASALEHMTTGLEFWSRYARMYLSRNKAALYNRVGYIDMKQLTIKAQADIGIIKNWKPGQNNLNIYKGTEVPFKQ